jgi:diguanylate cyclase (GGDEF)-like protein
VTTEKLAELELLHRAEHNPFTRLANRAGFDQVVDNALGLVKRDGQGIALLLIDLDGFKAVNDIHCHLAGDTVLKTVAMRFHSARRKGDFIARLGGDEFACVMEDAFLESLETVAGRILAQASEPMTFGSQQLRVSCCIGMALLPDHAADPRGLYERADHAMYKIMTSGKRGYGI